MVKVFVNKVYFTTGYGVYGAPKDIPPIAAPILGGKNADKNEYPWLVMLKYNGGFRCSGSIISEKTILTAAHCVSYDPDQRYCAGKPRREHHENMSI